MRTKVLLCVSLLLLPMLAVADDKKYEIDGIWYKLNYTGEDLTNTAEVTFGDEKYSGEIHIPATIFVPEFDHPEFHVTRIGEMAFKDCELTDFSHPESIVFIGREAFKNCVGVEYLSFPDEQMIRIGESAFEHSDVIRVNFQESFPTIEENAFRNCKSLQSVCIPKYIQNLGARAFYGCSELKSVTLETYDYRHGSDQDRKTLLKTIEAETFAYCPKLVMDIPEGVKVIGTGAFRGNFHGGGRTAVHLPRSLEAIESNAFEGHPVKNIYCYGFETEPPVVSPDAFDNPESITVHVSSSSSSLEAYENAESWKVFKEVVVFDDNPSKKCATPVVTYENGKISFTCETEDVEFDTQIFCIDIEKDNYDFENLDYIKYSNDIYEAHIGSAIDLNPTFYLRVYATKVGYLNSDPVITYITLTPGTSSEASGILGDVNNDKKVNGTDIQELINIIVNESINVIVDE